MFTRILYYKMMKIEQSMTFNPYANDKPKFIINEPRINFQEWALDGGLKFASPESVMRDTKDLEAVKNVWLSQKIEEIISPQIMSLLKSDPDLIISRIEQPLNWGIFDADDQNSDDCPF